MRYLQELECYMVRSNVFRASTAIFHDVFLRPVRHPPGTPLPFLDYEERHSFTFLTGNKQHQYPLFREQLYRKRSALELDPEYRRGIQPDCLVLNWSRELAVPQSLD